VVKTISQESNINLKEALANLSRVMSFLSQKGKAMADPSAISQHDIASFVTFGPSKALPYQAEHLTFDPVL
jgi:hypothetical protein